MRFSICPPWVESYNQILAHFFERDFHEIFPRPFICDRNTIFHPLLFYLTFIYLSDYLK